jgi:hypothetical protein
MLVHFCGVGEPITCGRGDPRRYQIGIGRASAKLDFETLTEIGTSAATIALARQYRRGAAPSTRISSAHKIL